MKSYLKITIAYATIFLLITTSAIAKPFNNIESLLTTHKWTLVEILSTLNDTTTNMTLFLVSCEKDNYVNFNSGGTYQIFEGETKCQLSDKDIKGEGTWRYDSSDSSLIDSYEGGKKISKTILVLTNEILKIRYEGEGKKILTLTYFSELGKEDSKINDIAVDNSDASQNIAFLIKQYLASTNRYVLVEKKSFEEGKVSGEDDKNNVLPKVVVLPFHKPSGTDKSINSERKKELMELAKRSGTNYVVCGNIIDATAAKKSNGYDGIIKYEVHVLDVKNDIADSRFFPGEKAKKKLDLKNIGQKSLKVLGGVLLTVGAIAFYNEAGFRNLYSYYFLGNAINKTANDVGGVFSDVDKDVRKAHIDSSKAILSSIAETQAAVGEFVEEEMPLQIKINNIEGEGKKARVLVEAGSNMHLQKNQELYVVRTTSNKVSDGRTIQKHELLGEISVEEIIADVLSSCSFNKNGKEIMEAYKQNPGELNILTAFKENKK